MAEKKLSTQEILALARKQAAGGAAGGDSATADKPSETPAAPETPPAPAAVDEAPESPTKQPTRPAPSSTPKSTAEILAAARAQASAKSGDGEASKPTATTEKPKATSDILAAARAQGAGSSSASQAKSGSTADILAAARAQGKAGGAPKAAAAATKAAPKKAASPVTSTVGDHPPIQEMVAAVKQVQRGERILPKLPDQQPRPLKPKLPEPKKISRRRFADYLALVVVTPFAVAWSIMAGIGGLWTLLGARFMMPNMVLELPSKFKIGPPSDFPLGVVNEKFKASRGVWVVHSDQYNGNSIIYALASVCTHLGCTPNWLEGEQKFKCPCHGSGFYITGINFEGPAPRPLERVGLRLAEDGMLEVDKSLKFQEELGQWSDPKSYVEIA